MHILLSSFSAQTPSNTSSRITVIVVAIMMVVAYWKIFTKAGEAGWKGIIPIYNLYTACKIIFGSGWYFLIMCIPLVSVIFGLFMQYKLAKAFGHGALFTLGLVLCAPVFMLILAFDNHTYLGPQ